MITFLLCMITVATWASIYLTIVYGKEVVGLLQLIAKSFQDEEKHPPTNDQNYYL